MPDDADANAESPSLKGIPAGTNTTATTKMAAYVPKKTNRNCKYSDQNRLKAGTIMAKTNSIGISNGGIHRR